LFDLKKMTAAAAANFSAFGKLSPKFVIYSAAIFATKKNWPEARNASRSSS